MRQRVELQTMNLRTLTVAIWDRQLANRKSLQFVLRLETLQMSDTSPAYGFAQCVKAVSTRCTGECIAMSLDPAAFCTCQRATWAQAHVSITTPARMFEITSAASQTGYETKNCK